MFVRWSARPSGRLFARLVEGRRVDGRVRQEHVGQLGWVPANVALTVADRRAFWVSAEAALARLSNRLDPKTEGDIRMALHARVPIVTPAELQALALEQAKRDARLWKSQAAQGEKIVEASEALVAGAQKQLAAQRDVLERDRRRAADAQARLERGLAGETIPETPSMSRAELKAFLEKLGVTPRFKRRARMLAGLSEEQFEELVQRKPNDRWPRRARP